MPLVKPLQEKFGGEYDGHIFLLKSPAPGADPAPEPPKADPPKKK
jgi:hypothetical protein